MRSCTSPTASRSSGTASTWPRCQRRRPPRMGWCTSWSGAAPLGLLRLERRAHRRGAGARPGLQRAGRPGAGLVRGPSRRGARHRGTRGRRPHRASGAALRRTPAAQRHEGIHIGGRSARPGSPPEAVAAGLSLVTEDRAHSGLFPDRSVRENLAAAWNELRGIVVRGERELAAGIVDRLGIVTPSVEQEVKRLSRRQPAEGAHRALAGRGRGGLHVR